MNPLAQAQWYLLQCRPRECQRAQDNLRNQNFECFLPLHPLKRKQRGKMVVTSEPLFPHYLFIRLCQESNWRVIRSTRGVARIVSFNGAPQIVSEEIVTGLQSYCFQLQHQVPAAPFAVGDRVRITEGCFKDLQAIVQATKGEDRVVLLLNLLNRTQAITLPMQVVSSMNYA